MSRVPKWVLDGLERLHPRYARLMVSAWVLYPNATFHTSDDYRDALQLWPVDVLERRTRATVLGILMELEALGVITDIQEDSDAFVVRWQRKAVGT